ncbi:MAG: type II toxin-antitoxin system YafQ family toxin [Gammaproteobacteria bacterium]|nr:type II toxin-antitoxin system YafQ family toxin [Gammaproteobacteria bacterium]MCD8541923.1 type II toxin-antitoxin system YafQ family toxin [Gammaproteobacteria bacterium]
MLLEQKKLPIKNKDHFLTRNYAKRKECHIKPDWLLIYIPAKEEILNSIDDFSKHSLIHGQTRVFCVEIAGK